MFCAKLNKAHNAVSLIDFTEQVLQGYYIFSMVRRCVSARTLRHIQSDITELNCTKMTNVTLHLVH